MLHFLRKQPLSPKIYLHCASKIHQYMIFDERKIHRYLIGAILLVQFISLFVDIMDIDASQYASISLEMLKGDSWLQIKHRHLNYLDKPPLLFWLSAMSFKLFGVSNFTYKLPSFLFALLGMYSTYRLTKIYYGQRAGRLAAIILGSSQALFSIIVDVRTDTLLLGSVIFSIWQLTAYIRRHSFKNLLWGFIGISLAMLAKGPIGIMVPVLALGTDLVLRQKWKDIFKWQWLVGLLIVGLMLLPMSYGLYEQFDSNPAAEVNGKTGVSGLYFYFWEQSFGRLTGENVWSNNTGPFYFVHTSLWAFLPWTIMLIMALYNRIRSFFGASREKYTEYISVAGFILPFIALSLSKYKLPHYIYVVYPLAAMMTAAYLDKIDTKSEKIILQIQKFILFGLWILAFILLFYIFTPTNILVAIFALGILGMMIWLMVKLPPKNVLIIATAMTGLGVNLILNGQAYPRLLTYQSTSQVGKWLRQHPKELKQFATYRTHMHAIDFYSRTIVNSRSDFRELTPKDQYIYTDEQGVKDLEVHQIPFVVMKTYQDFAVTRLTIRFLNPKTRDEAVGRRFLVRVYWE